MREERRERRGQEKYDIGKMREREKYIIPTIARRINSQQPSAINSLWPLQNCWTGILKKC